MSKQSKQDARDRWTQDHIARSSKFSACMFLGCGRYDKREAPTIEQARQLAGEMLAEHGTTNFGRGVLIYAITPEGLSIVAEAVK